MARRNGYLKIWYRPDQEIHQNNGCINGLKNLQNDKEEKKPKNKKESAKIKNALQNSTIVYWYIRGLKSKADSVQELADDY